MSTDRVLSVLNSFELAPVAYEETPLIYTVQRPVKIYNKNAFQHPSSLGIACQAFWLGVQRRLEETTGLGCCI